MLVVAIEQLWKVGFEFAAEHRVDVRPFGEEVQRPSDAGGCRVVPAPEERHDLVAQGLEAECLPEVLDPLVVTDYHGHNVARADLALASLATMMLAAVSRILLLDGLSALSLEGKYFPSDVASMKNRILDHVSNR